MKINLSFPGEAESNVFEGMLSQLYEKEVAKRIWADDYTLWSDKPDEISDRLGWLNVMDFSAGHIGEMQNFSREVRLRGISDVVLLGMGGSSLGAKVMNKVFGSAEGYPRLTVLDSIIPEAVTGVMNSISPPSTLFLVASKSGTTIETRSLFDYFYDVEDIGGKKFRGEHFVTITDPGSPLNQLGKERQIWRTFENPENIGGRYSVLSYFGLVPAALIGVDVRRLLDSADTMRKRCLAELAPEENEGLRFGAFLGALAQKGRDKITVVKSKSFENFGLWTEQLIAESTGKHDIGMIPIVGEPLADVNLYGPDRLFVYVRLEGDDNTLTDTFIDSLTAGHPVAKLTLSDTYELGALFYLWEFAIAVSGIVLGINPFDQPDVQKEKDATEFILKQYLGSGKLPAARHDRSFHDLVSDINGGSYFAIMAYMHQIPHIDGAFNTLRLRLLQEKQIPTTFDYGPRYLHSTGQLYKGGPDEGLFLQVVLKHYEDVDIPGKPYSFGTISQAEALGDLQALQSKGRKVARLELEPDLVKKELEKLMSEL